MTGDFSEVKVRSLLRNAASWYDKLIVEEQDVEAKNVLHTEQLWYYANVDSIKDLMRVRGDIL